MPGQTQREIGWRIGDRRQTLADLYQRSGFNSLDQLNQNDIENTDLLFAQSIRFDQKKIGDLPEHGQPSFRRTALQRGIEFIEQAGGIGFLHDLNPKEFRRGELPRRFRGPAA
jgi:hypothetical protein